MIINKLRYKILSPVLFLGLSLLISTSLWGHSGTHSQIAVPQAEILNHTFFLFRLIVEESLNDIQGGEGTEFVDRDFEFTLQNLEIPSNLTPSVQRALRRYEAEAHQVPDIFSFQDTHKTFLKKVWLSFIEAIASGVEGGARYGIAFGIGYALWELAEHLILKGIPVGSGPLCTVFPLIWSSLVIPLTEPFKFLTHNPDRESLSTSLQHSLKDFRLRRKWQRARKTLLLHENIRIRKSDDEKSQNAAKLHEALLKGGALWHESLLYFYGERLGLPSQVSKKPLIHSLIQRLRNQGRLDPQEIIQVENLISEPIEILSRMSRELYEVNQTGFWAYMKMQQELGWMKKMAERLSLALFRLSLQSEIRLAEAHANELNAIWHQAFELMNSFSFQTEDRAPFRQLLRNLHQRIHRFSRGVHCREILSRLN